MDRHEMRSLTAENVAEAHRKDLEIQDKYGVKYMAYWYDVDRGTGFCLVEAPNAATASHVHRQAHGEIPSEIISVDLAVVEALIGFADPVFGRNSQQLQQNPRLAADVTAARGIRGTLADLAELKDALPPLPETAKEVREVAASVKAKVTDVFVGPDATETRVKREKLDQYRIVYFATHGLLAGDISGFAKLEAEPALVLSLPEKPTEFDDGLLSASEVAQLKLNADWVVLSACNTTSGETPGAEALSGLARAFFYAGGRSLLVSNWEVESNSAVALMVETFRSLATEPKLSHGEALQMSMLADDQQPAAPGMGRSLILGAIRRRWRTGKAGEIGRPGSGPSTAFGATFRAQLRDLFV
jgi:CHAT domain/Protein of unknown function (DUF4242)